MAALGSGRLGEDALKIVGGELGGRRFAGPSGTTTRPTSERVREALASALEARGAIRGARVLDLYAGTGALAFEAISRGAECALLIDRDKRAVTAFAKSAKELGIATRIKTACLDLKTDPRQIAKKLLGLAEGFDLVFADPPYADIDHVAPLIDAMIEEGLLDEDAFVVIEHAKRQAPKTLGRLALIAEYTYGDSAIALARPTLSGDDVS